MEKIQVQFNESDYEIYHNYCQRYYSILDAGKKQSIRLLLELYEQDLLPVQEHDLEEAVIFFSKKCEEALADSGHPGKNDTRANIPGARICREMPFLMEDLEKIYRLIKKTGTAPNYVLVLATFSKIIDDESKADTYLRTETDRKIIETYAPAIAGVIRKRLGPDTGWESVLYELTRQVMKFNRSSFEEKIDRNCISLIGPAVVADFDVSVGHARVRQRLDQIFEERELTEFESRLNNNMTRDDDNSAFDISDSFMFEVLRSIARKEMVQGNFTTAEEPGFLKTAELPAVILPSAIARNPDTDWSTGWGYMQYPMKMPHRYSDRFGIEVSNTVKSEVVLPEVRESFPFHQYKNNGIPQFTLMFLGLIILILFAVTMAATSGAWNPEKTLGNTSIGIAGNGSGLAGLQKNPALPAKTAQGVFLSAPPEKTASENVANEGKNSPLQPAPTKTIITTADINRHFYTTAFGSGNSKIMKRAEDRISLALTGDNTDEDLALLEQFAGRFNNYSSTNKFTAGIKSGDKATIVVFFLPGSSMQAIRNTDGSDIDGSDISRNPDTDEIQFIHERVKIDFVTKDIIYINSDLQGDQRKHWMLRGLLYELGFTGETNDYPDSIFYAGSDNTTELSDMDMKAVGIMYGKKITAGMTADRVKSMLLL